MYRPFLPEPVQIWELPCVKLVRKASGRQVRNQKSCRVVPANATLLLPSNLRAGWRSRHYRAHTSARSSSRRGTHSSRERASRARSFRWMPRSARTSTRTACSSPRALRICASPSALCTQTERAQMGFDVGYRPADSTLSDSDSDSDSEDEGNDAQESKSEKPAPAPTYAFPALDAQIREAIRTYEGGVFPKLNFSAPQDAAWLLPAGAPLRCTAPADVYLLLKSSDFVSHDLDEGAVFAGCDDAVKGVEGKRGERGSRGGAIRARARPAQMVRRRPRTRAALLRSRRPARRCVPPSLPLFQIRS